MTMSMTTETLLLTCIFYFSGGQAPGPIPYSVLFGLGSLDETVGIDTPQLRDTLKRKILRKCRRGRSVFTQIFSHNGDINIQTRSRYCGLHPSGLLLHFLRQLKTVMTIKRSCFKLTPAELYK